MHEIGTVRTLWYCESCNTIEIPWRPHRAWFDHTGYSPTGARMDAGRGARCTRERFGCGRGFLIVSFLVVVVWNSSTRDGTQKTKKLRHTLAGWRSEY